MNFIKQIKLEVKNILGMKFVLILGILMLLFSIAWPIFNAIDTSSSESGIDGRARPLSKGYDEPYYGEEPIIVDGITIEPNNPFYWNVKGTMDEMENINNYYRFENAGTKDIYLALLQEDINYYLPFAKTITTYNDYRVELAWSNHELRYERFIHLNIDTSDIDALKEAINMRYYIGDKDVFEAKFVNISAMDRIAAIEEADDMINRTLRIVENNDFPEYIALRIEQEQHRIETHKDMIALYERQIIENPQREEELKWDIEWRRKDIQIINNNNIPLLEYRLEKNIKPNTDVWQNTAISEMQNAQVSLEYMTVMTEEEFNKNPENRREHGSYAQYMEQINKQIDEYNSTILIARASIDSDKPDLKYVPSAARGQTLDFLIYGTIVALFAIVLGGLLMASEFQLGTIRLLMIRPRTRVKILMSKFTAALIVCIALFIAGVIINIVMNGICFGFADFAFPKFSAAGQTGFFAYYLPMMLACIVPILFAFCVAFMLSTIAKNIAVAISVPVVCFVACVIVMSLLIERFGFHYYYDFYPGMPSNITSEINWLAWTPVPYVQLSNFFTVNSPLQNLIKAGMPLQLWYGLSVMGVLSAVCAAISVLAFRRRDITQ